MANYLHWGVWRADSAISRISGGPGLMANDLSICWENPVLKQACGNLSTRIELAPEKSAFRVTSFSAAFFHSATKKVF
jgi:hypothetical protein